MQFKEFNSPPQPQPQPQRWVTMDDIEQARLDIRHNAWRRVPWAIVRSLSISIAVIIGVMLLAWYWLKPSEYPDQWLAPSTAWIILQFFFTPWPLVYIHGDYHDQLNLIRHISRRLKLGEHIPMPQGGLLKVPLLHSED